MVTTDEVDGGAGLEVIIDLDGNIGDISDDVGDVLTDWDDNVDMVAGVFCADIDCLIRSYSSCRAATVTDTNINK